MKICFFTENYRKGGVDTFLINLFNAWPDPEDELTLLCNSAHAGLETITEKTKRPIKIEKYNRIFASKIAKGQSDVSIHLSYLVRIFFAVAFRILQYLILFPWYVYTLLVYFRGSDFDRLMVVNGGYPASLLCRCAPIAWRLSGKSKLALFNFHNAAIRPSWYCKFFENFIDQSVIDTSQAVVTVSEWCLGTLQNRTPFLGCSKLRFIFNGIEDPVLKLNRGGGLDCRNVGDHSRYCLMLASYEPRKGHSFLFKAFKSVLIEFPNVRLMLFGFGTAREKKKVNREVRRLGLERSITLNDFVAETGPLLANASLLAVPSQAYESFGLTIIEAMAFGIPVVTTDVGGIPEVLKNSHAGFVCSKDDSGSFADAMKVILRDPVLAAELGRNGRMTFEQKFTASRMARQYNSLLKSEEAYLYEQA